MGKKMRICANETESLVMNDGKYEHEPNIIYLLHISFDDLLHEVWEAHRD